MHDGLETVETLLCEDAAKTLALPTAAETRMAMEKLSPAIAAEAAKLRRQRKQRREALLLAAIALPILLLMVFMAMGYLRGNTELLMAALLPAGVLSAMALLTLPIMERFIIKN